MRSLLLLLSLRSPFRAAVSMSSPAARPLYRRDGALCLQADLDGLTDFGQLAPLVSNGELEPEWIASTFDKAFAMPALTAVDRPALFSSGAFPVPRRRWAGVGTARPR